MTFRFSRPTLALAALFALSVSTPVFAQDVPGLGSTPAVVLTPDTVAVDTLAAKPAPAAADTARYRTSPFPLRRATMGGYIGGSALLADKDYSHARQPDGTYGDRNSSSRFMFAAQIRYTFARQLRWQLELGYTWSAYSDDGLLPFPDPLHPEDVTTINMVTQVLPITAQLQYVLNRGPWYYHVGAGGGGYRVWVTNQDDVMKDPVTDKLHRGFYPGLTGELGLARRLPLIPWTTWEFSLAGHWIFAQRDEQFPSGLNSTLFLVDAKFGVNFHWDPARPNASPAAAGLK
jgi:hypothetical protein